MWREHPWLGVGPGGVKRRYADYARPEAVKRRTSHVHSAPLQIAVERGLLGLATWLWIWVAFYRWAWRAWRAGEARSGRERALVAGAVAAVSGFLVAGLTEYNFGDTEVALVLWTVMALAFTAGREA
jgi:O-antigen ligase